MNRQEDLTSRTKKMLEGIKADSAAYPHNIKSLSHYCRLFELNNSYGTCLVKCAILLKTANGKYYWNPETTESIKDLSIKLVRSVDLYKRGNFEEQKVVLLEVISIEKPLIIKLKKSSLWNKVKKKFQKS